MPHLWRNDDTNQESRAAGQQRRLGVLEMRDGQSADRIQSQEAQAETGEEMTPDAINARLQQIIVARCAGNITRRECAEEVRYLRSLLPENELAPTESGSNWTQTRAYARLAAISTGKQR